VRIRALIAGTGAVGARAARQLLSTEDVDQLALFDPDPARAHAISEALAQADRVSVVDPEGDGTLPPEELADVDVLVLAGPPGQAAHRLLAERALEHGTHVVSASDAIADVRDLLRMDAEARERGLSAVVGAGFAPGLSCILARHAAASFDQVDEIHVARLGTAGPACARHHHDALSADAIDWRDGAWAERPGGSGRELCWFPDPVGGRDCYRAGLPDALLLVPAFSHVQRVTARLSATRRDRWTSWLPMLRPPHPEGTLGAIRVEVRGRRGPARDAAVLGAIDRPALAAGAVAATAAVWAVAGRFSRPGAAGLAELVDDPVPFLRSLADRGVRAAVFEGAAVAGSAGP
jgi:saccharopine dehydrogenase-like NADP-dependent oxidoreductase